MEGGGRNNATRITELGEGRGGETRPGGEAEKKKDEDENEKDEGTGMRGVTQEHADD